MRGNFWERLRRRVQADLLLPPVKADLRCRWSRFHFNPRSHISYRRSCKRNIYASGTSTDGCEGSTVAALHTERRADRKLSFIMLSWDPVRSVPSPRPSIPHTHPHCSWGRISTPKVAASYKNDSDKGRSEGCPNPSSSTRPLRSARIAHLHLRPRALATMRIHFASMRTHFATDASENPNPQLASNVRAGCQVVFLRVPEVQVLARRRSASGRGAQSVGISPADWARAAEVSRASAREEILLDALRHGYVDGVLELLLVPPCSLAGRSGADSGTCASRIS